MGISIAPGAGSRSAWCRFAGTVVLLSSELGGMGSAFAEVTPDTQYKTYLTKAQTVEPLGDFGEQISLRAGTLSFRNVDIELPGNGPTIRIIRTAQLEDGYATRAGSGNSVGGWEFEIPRLKTITANPASYIPPARTLSSESPIGWQVQADDKNSRCTNFGPPAKVSYDASLVWFNASQWWFGYQIVDDTGGEQSVFRRTADMVSQPTYKIGTRDNWVLSCLPNTANGQPGEAFQAIAPDGTKYWFNYLTYTGYNSLTLVFDNQPPNGGTMNYTLGRHSASMLVTRVEDRFGNWLTYSYSGTKLIGIDASDGRKVSLAWQADGVDITVGTGTDIRTWIYRTGGGYTMQLTRPDGSRWQYSGEYQLPFTSPYEYVGCSQVYFDEPTGSRQVSVTAPTGAMATFALGRRHFGRSYVPKYCADAQIPNSDDGYALIPKLWIGYALTSKTVTGPGLPTRVWNYTYSPHNASWAENCPTPASCASTVWTQVADPDGDKTVSYFSNKWDQTENKLVKEETYTSANALLRTVEYSYATAPSNAANPYAWPLKIGLFTNYNANTEVDLRWTPLQQRKITQQGTAFTWQANTFDAFARALSATRASNLGYSRTDVTAYHDNLTKWVLGQVASSTNSNTGLVESQTIYDPTYALPIQTKAFGKLQQTLAYDMASAVATGQRGTLLTVKDGNNNVTTLTQWKRGIPGKIAFADGEFKSAVIDDLGQIQTVTDENGFITNYDYDAMGRLSLIDYPDGDTVNWANTTIAFAKNNAAVYGLPAGHWYQAATTGNARKVTYFDALWRPVVVAEYDNADIAGTLRQSVTRYDAEGRPTFASYPQRETNAAVYNTWANPAVAPTLAGTDTVYDALGRVLTTKADSELPGQLTTTYEYLSSFQTKVTNPRGFATTYRYYAYDQPSTDQLRMVIHPEGAITEFYRDAFGKPLNLIRHNSDSSVSVNRTYTYTSNTQELCRTVEPETGATDYGYDAAGNLKWSAAGLPSNIGCDLEGDHSVIAPRRVDRTYDARNRLKTLSFPDGLGNQTWTYTPDGLTQSIVTDNGGGKVATNTYAYNQRRLMTDEDLSVAGVFNWPIDYGYDVHGHLTVQNWHGVSVGFSPNALGQPTRAGTYATGVKYYPNGAMKEFTYGNGILHLLTQNARGLPDRSLDIYQSFHYLDDGYDYDQNGNVAAISDGRDGNHRGNRTMTYDGLDRLKTAVSPMYGNAAYAYDVLDNLTRVTVGGTAARDHYYCYDAANRLTNVKTGSCAGTSVIGLGYDVQGNLANKNGTTYTFDFGNRLRSVATSPVSAYAYDGHGRRVWDVTSNDKYSHYNQAGQLTMTADERAGKVIEYIHLNGSLVATRERDTLTNVYSTRYHHTDALGSPVAVTDESRAMVEKSEYEPFGFVNNRPAKDGPGYTGHVLDAATGLNYMQQRYYDPRIGRFLSRDPVTADAKTGANFNAYWYANNNPYKFVDPDGRAVITPIFLRLVIPLIFPNRTTSPTASDPSDEDFHHSSDGPLGRGGRPVRTDRSGNPIFPNEVYNNSEQNSGRKTPNSGEPGSVYVNPSNGQERLYGEDGLPAYDVDYNHDHGQGSPHDHEWTRDGDGKPVRGPAKPAPKREETKPKEELPDDKRSSQ